MTRPPPRGAKRPRYVCAACFRIWLTDHPKSRPPRPLGPLITAIERLAGRAPRERRRRVRRALTGVPADRRACSVECEDEILGPALAELRR